MQTPRRRAPIAVGVVALVAGAGIGAQQCDRPPPTPENTFEAADCHPTTKYVGECGSLGDRVREMEPGDTLYIAPGSYDVGKILWYDVQGTAEERITITALDPSNRPVINGWLTLWDADYVTLDSLRLHAAYMPQNAGALSYNCGTGWIIRDSELWGADETHSYWNLGIGGLQPGPPSEDKPSDCKTDEPADFAVVNNVFHNPWVVTDPKVTLYHHIYAYFEGSPGGGGTIARNLFHGFRSGAGIKLGAASPLCPRNVRIEYNTFYDGVRALVMEDDIRGISIDHNLMDQIREGGGYSGKHLAVALGNVAAANPPNTIAHTYVANNANSSQLIWGAVFPGPGVLEDLGDNPYRPAGDPAWNNTDPRSPGSFRPSNPQAAPYGRYGLG